MMNDDDEFEMSEKEDANKENRLNYLYSIELESDIFI